MIGRPEVRTVQIAGLLALASCSSAGSLGRGVTIDKLGAGVRLESEFRDESFEGGAAASTKEAVLRENVEFDFDGNIYHPRLLTFGGVLDLGLEQRRLEQRGASATVRSDDDNNRYDLRAALLKDHPYSARFSAQRSQVRVRQSFFPTSDAVVVRNGGTVMAKEWYVPSQLEIASYDFDGRSGDLRSESRQTVNLTGSKNTDRFDLNYTWFAQTVDSDLAGERYDDFLALAGGTWRFGRELSNSLTVDGQQRRQTGDTRNENANFSGRLHLEVADHLDHRSGVTLGRSEFRGLGESATDRVDAFSEFEHRLYESLTSVVRADYLRQSIGAGEIDRVGGGGQLGYRKNLPFGKLRADFRLGRSRQEESGRLGANVTVSDESHVVVAGDPVILDNANVDEANVLVTDGSGSVVYAAPADFLLERIGVRTRLVIPVGSRIQPGQTILVTYSHASLFDRAFQTDSQAVALELMLGESLSFEGTWSDLAQELVEGVADATLDEATEVGVGMRAKLWDQNFAIEYLDRDSRLTPYSRGRVMWYTWWPVSDRMSLNASASGHETLFKDEQLRERGVSGVLNLVWKADDRLTAELRSELRRSDTRTDDGWGTFVHGLVRYRFRKTTIDVSVMNSMERWDISSDRDVLRAFFTVSRKF